MRPNQDFSQIIHGDSLKPEYSINYSCYSTCVNLFRKCLCANFLHYNFFVFTKSLLRSDESGPYFWTSLLIRVKWANDMTFLFWNIIFKSFQVASPISAIRISTCRIDKTTTIRTGSPPNCEYVSFQFLKKSGFFLVKNLMISLENDWAFFHAKNQLKSKCNSLHQTCKASNRTERDISHFREAKKKTCSFFFENAHYLVSCR